MKNRILKEVEDSKHDRLDSTILLARLVVIDVLTLYLNFECQLLTTLLINSRSEGTTISLESLHIYNLLHLSTTFLGTPYTYRIYHSIQVPTLPTSSSALTLTINIHIRILTPVLTLSPSTSFSHFHLSYHF